MRWAGLICAHGNDINYVQDFQSAYMVGWHLHRWVGNIEMDPKGANCSDVD